MQKEGQEMIDKFYGVGIVDKNGDPVMDSRTMDRFFDGSGYDIDERVDRLNSSKSNMKPYRAVELFYKEEK